MKFNRKTRGSSGYFTPIVVYREADEPRIHSILRYVGNRVNTSNKNFLCAVVGQTGTGKSWSCLSMAEIYSRMYNKPFDPKYQVITSLKQMLELITAEDVDKKIRFGSAVVFDEPQVEGNARNWQSEMNQALSQLISTFRNQRLVVFFATPFLSMIDKQSRILFHGEFKVLGFDRNTGFTRVKPRFLEYNPMLKNDFYRKRLIVVYKSSNKVKFQKTKVNIWEVEKASKETIDIYEGMKKKFTTDLNRKLLDQITLKEKAKDGVNKNEELLKIKKLYEERGEDYLYISEQMPHLNPHTIQKYIWYIKKSLKKPMASRVLNRITYNEPIPVPN